jgi:E3 ubiquitin-protein ligase HUWE1
MLGQPLTYEDIEGVDPAYYKNLVWMLENDITEVLDLTFTAETDYFGLTAVVELVPGGSKIKVTEVNKKEYVNLIARHRMTTSIKEQLQVREGVEGLDKGAWHGGGWRCRGLCGEGLVVGE